MQNDTKLLADNFDYYIWISDIHLQSENNTSDDYQQILNEFVEKFSILLSQKIKGSTRKIFLMISGDLAFSGSPDEYRYFKSLLKKMIPTNIHDRILVVPCSGNHDTRWSELIAQYYQNKEELVTLFRSRNENFQPCIDSDAFHFDRLFEAYRTNMSYDSNKENSFYGIENLEGLTCSKRYYSTGLEGYIVDDETKTIIVILNSAWYSLGGSLRMFLEKAGEGLPIKKVAELMDASQETGRLVTGLNSENTLFEIDKALQVLQDPSHSDYLKIVMTHYPLSFLDPEELHSYADNLQATGTKLTEILRSSNILISGHTHPTAVQRVEYLEDLEVRHYHAPMMLNHYHKSDTKVDKLLPCNGFAIMNVDRLQRKYQMNYFDIDYCKRDGVRILPGVTHKSLLQRIKAEQEALESEARNHSISTKNETLKVITDSKDCDLSDFHTHGKTWNTYETKYFHLHRCDHNGIELIVLPKTADMTRAFVNRKSNETQEVVDFLDFISSHLVEQDKKLTLVTVTFPKSFLVSLGNISISSLYDSSPDLFVQKQADKGMNRFRTTLFNYVDSRIEDKGYVDLFKLIESCLFNVKVLERQ